MKLSKLYSNRPSIFEPINFVDGLNVVVAEIRKPENRNRDTHNLGKTTLGLVLDFALLSTRDARFFLFKYPQFEDFEFFIELALTSGGYITVRRSVIEASKASFKRHYEPKQDLTGLTDDDWDHFQVSFDRARTILDGYLDLNDLDPWSFRKGLGYLLRTQADYSDVFQLNRFAAKHADWKPFVAHILGFDSQAVGDVYSVEDELEELKNTATSIELQSGGGISDLGRIDGLLSLKRKEIARVQDSLEAFDFRVEDKDRVKKLVDDIDEQLAELNADRYRLSHALKRVNAAISEGQVLFDTNAAAELFNEVGVSFSGQLKRDFDQLLEFNKAITAERRQYLLEDRGEISVDLKRVNAEINRLGRRRSESLAFLTSTDTFEKYKSTSDRLATLRADAILLDNQRESIHKLQQLRADIRTKEAELEHTQTRMETNIESETAPESEGIFANIRLYFDDFVKFVIDRPALLTVSVNNQHHPEFGADILDQDGNVTSADSGTSYKKLLCVAFDLAIARAHDPRGYPQFVYHDGVFESLDPRKKANLLEVMRDYADLGIQQIITLIDSDAPPPLNSGEAPFESSEVILQLHDEGQSGRLFKMKAW